MPKKPPFNHFRKSCCSPSNSNKKEKGITSAICSQQGMCLPVPQVDVWGRGGGEQEGCSWWPCRDNRSCCPHTPGEPLGWAHKEHWVSFCNQHPTELCFCLLRMLCSLQCLWAVQQLSHTRAAWFPGVLGSRERACLQTVPWRGHFPVSPVTLLCMQKDRSSSC